MYIIGIIRLWSDDFFSFSKISGMKDLMQLIESKQFMAHANSILEAESNTTTNAGDKVSKGISDLKARLDYYCKDPAKIWKKKWISVFLPKQNSHHLEMSY